MKIRKKMLTVAAAVVSCICLCMGMLLCLPKVTAKADDTLQLAGGVSADGLAAYWKFDETSGETAMDSSPYARNMWLSNGSTANWDTGLSGGAFRFDGNSAFRMQIDRTGAPNRTSAGVPYQIESDKNADGSAKTNGDSSLSVSFLMKIDDWNMNTDQGFNTLFVTGNTTGAGSLGSGSVQSAIIIAEKTNENVDVGKYDPEYAHKWLFGGINGSGGGLTGNDNIVNADGNIDDKMGGGWNLITYVIEDSEEDDVAEMRLYINGKLDYTVELLNTMGLMKTLGMGAEPLCVGGQVDAEQGNSIIRGFSGYMDEFMIFTRALSSSEVSAMAKDYFGENADTETKPSDSGKKSGCGSAVNSGAWGLGAVALLGISCVAVICKRKKSACENIDK